MEFLPLSRRRSSARNVPSDEERGETDVFAGYQSPPPPQTPLSVFFCSEGRGRLYTGYLERIIHLQTVRQNWRIKSGRFIQNWNRSIFKLRRITYLARIIKWITRLTWMICFCCENGHFCYKWIRAPALSWAFACLLLLFHKDYFYIDCWHFYA